MNFYKNSLLVWTFLTGASCWDHTGTVSWKVKTVARFQKEPLLPLFSEFRGCLNPGAVGWQPRWNTYQKGKALASSASDARLSNSSLIGSFLQTGVRCVEGLLSFKSTPPITGGRVKTGDKLIKSRRDRKPGGGPSAGVGGSEGGPLFWGRDLFELGGWSSHTVQSQGVRGGTWGGPEAVGGVREGPGRSPLPARSAGRSSVSDPLAGSSDPYQPWPHGAGAGGLGGRRGLGSGRLPPGAPRVGAEHPWRWMGAREGRPESAKWRGWSQAGAQL